MSSCGRSGTHAELPLLDLEEDLFCSFEQKPILAKFSILTPQCYWIDTKSCWYGTLAGTEASEDGDTPVCHPLTSDPTLSSPLLRPWLPPHLLPPSAPVAVLASGYDLFRSSPGSRVQTEGGGCCVQVLSVCSAHFQCRAELS